MRKVALVFVVAVFVPSLVLAWLAVRSLRDQQLVMERQQASLCQGVADGLAKEVASALAAQQRAFAQQVESLLVGHSPLHIAGTFDERLRQAWPPAEVGFAVSLEGNIYSPSMFDRAAARQFRLENERFLTSRETLDVIWNSPKGAINLSKLDRTEDRPASPAVPAPWSEAKGDALTDAKSVFATKTGKVPALSENPAQTASAGNPAGLALSCLGEFRHFVGDSTEGTLARFLQDQLRLLFWYRSPRDPRLIFGAQLNLPTVASNLAAQIRVEPDLQHDLVAALINDSGEPAGDPGSEFHGDWKQPFVTTAIGEVLPHWKVGVWLRDPRQLGQSAHAVRLTLGLLIAVLVLAIAVGGWLIVADLRRQLTAARQKTDFVSNVSHELKTPLTSIRMFAEMLAEGRVAASARQKTFLNAITSETARLTRLVNNVLDFSRMERGEKKYRFNPCDLAAVVRETVESYRPHLEASGFHLRSELPDQPVVVQGDSDALAQVLVNLLSNAEKYAGERKEIAVQLAANGAASPAEVRVLDRGLGVPPGCEEKIFEQFYRAHDSLSSGIQGAGLGLTLARQIARAHGGDVTCQRRQHGGSCFTLSLPREPAPKEVTPRAHAGADI